MGILDGTLKTMGYSKMPKPPKPPKPPKNLGEEVKEILRETMVVNVSKKEDELQKQVDELKKKLQKQDQPVKEEPKIEKELPKIEETVPSDIELQVKEFYDEYGIFNATASNETLQLNLLYGILQELKKLNKK